MDTNTSDRNGSPKENAALILDVYQRVMIGVTFPFTIWAIYATCCQVRKGNTALIYIINLFISDLIQLCCAIAFEITDENQEGYDFINYLFYFGMIGSVFFMVCVAIERYLVIACPLWYRFRRTIKISVIFCVVVWVLVLGCLLSFILFEQHKFITISIFLFPIPLLMFTLGGTLKGLSASRVPSDEKRRIVGILVLVLLLYLLGFLPRTIYLLFVVTSVDLVSDWSMVSVGFLRVNPLADVFLYLFMRKGFVDKASAVLCCCRMGRNDTNDLAENGVGIKTVCSTQAQMTGTRQMPSSQLDTKL